MRPEKFPYSGFLEVFLGGQGAELQRMDPAGQLLGQDRVNPALPGDAVFADKTRGDNLEPEMRLLAVMGPAMMPSVEMRIIVDVQPRWLQRGFQFLANSLCCRHARSHRDGAASRAKKPRCQAALAAIRAACHRSNQPPYSFYAPSALFF